MIPEIFEMDVLNIPYVEACKAISCGDILEAPGEVGEKIIPCPTAHFETVQKNI